mgnify:CR=1 FL=1
MSEKPLSERTIITNKEAQSEVRGQEVFVSVPGHEDKAMSVPVMTPGIIVMDKAGNLTSIFVPTLEPDMEIIGVCHG